MTNQPAHADDLRRPEPQHTDAPHMYVYEPAGIRERSGYIPMWLKAVAVGLIVWGIFYAIRYWSSY